MYESSFTSAGTAVISTGVPNANTDYAVLMHGSFSITASGSVAVQFSSELNGSQVTLQPGSVLIIRSLDPNIAGGGI